MRYFLLLSAACVLAAGCSDGPRRYHIKGAATFQGQPVPAGYVYFDPDVAKGNNGPQGYAVIKDGAYDTAAPSGKGTVGGPHVVRVEGYDGKSTNAQPLGSPLFSDFREELDLPRAATTHDFKVNR